MTTRYLFILLILTSMGNLQCSGAKSASAPEADEIPAAPVQSAEGFGAALAQAVAGNSLDHLIAYIPDAAIVRQVAPGETGEMSDQEIEEKMQGMMKQRLSENIDNLHHDALKKGLKPGEIQFLSQSTESFGEGTSVNVMTIQLGAEKFKADVPVTSMEIEGKTYIFEILLSTDLFK